MKNKHSRRELRGEDFQKVIKGNIKSYREDYECTLKGLIRGDIDEYDSYSFSSPSLDALNFYKENIEE